MRPTPLEMTVRNSVPVLVATDPRVRVGDCTYGQPVFLLWADTDCVEIGKFCSIAEGVTIFGGGEHRTDWVTTYPLRIAFADALAGKDGHPASKGPTRIGNDVWIGYRATVLSGVEVGDGAVIGAGAVVGSNVAPYSIVRGNPARVIRKRFLDAQIAKLLTIKWWDWPLEKVRDAIPLLCSSNIETFIAHGAHSTENRHSSR